MQPQTNARIPAMQNTNTSYSPENMNRQINYLNEFSSLNADNPYAQKMVLEMYGNLMQKQQESPYSQLNLAMDLMSTGDPRMSGVAQKMLQQNELLSQYFGDDMQDMGQQDSVGKLLRETFNNRDNLTEEQVMGIGEQIGQTGDIQKIADFNRLNKATTPGLMDSKLSAGSIGATLGGLLLPGIGSIAGGYLGTKYADRKSKEKEQERDSILNQYRMSY
jgi:hypothetical protein